MNTDNQTIGRTMRLKKVIGILFLCAIFSVVGFLGARMMFDNENDRWAAEAPIKAVRVVVADNQLELLFEKIREFSKQHAFAVRIAPAATMTDSYLIQLWREDINITGANSFGKGAFQIGFYKNSPLDIPDKHLDFLVKDLKKLVNEIPGAEFSVIDVSKNQ